MSPSWKSGVTSTEHIIQGYIKPPDDGVSEVRVRISTPSAAPPFAAVALKSVGGLSRTEIELPVDLDQARELLSMCQGLVIEKTRHFVPSADGLTFEVDVYSGKLLTLVTVDVEVPSEDTVIPQVSWLGGEITGQRGYANAVMAKYGVPMEFLLSK